MTLKTAFLIVFVSFFIFISPTLAEKTTSHDNTFTVKDITWQTDQNSWVYKIKGDRIPTYTRYELFSPHRLRLDIAGGLISEDFALPLQPEKGPVSTIRGKVVQNEELKIFQLELALKSDVEYNVQSKGKDILVRLSPTEQEKTAPAGKDDEQFISKINIHSKAKGNVVEINTGKPIHSCEATEISGSKTSPPQLVVDLDFVKTEKLTKKGPENSLISTIKAEPYKDGSRLWITSSSSNLFDYELLTSENGLHIEMQPSMTETEELLAAISGRSTTKKKISARQPREIVPRIKTTKGTKVQDREKEPAYSDDQFSGAGYSGEKITVDFYQSNLHNVFRLIGKVSGRNIIVAEGVGGTLTLSLKDVPWDFMLDIILNLKNLKKEEQFNTIIISTASQKFEWPGQDEKEDLVMSRPEPVSRESEEIKGTMEAAKILRRAKSAKQSGNLQKSLSLYEKAFDLNPERGDIAGQITSLALTGLSLNAKAAYYGKIACRLKPEDSYLALLTATALAKTGKPEEAVKYYELAASGPHPSAHALTAYAAFSEEYKSYRMALDLWDKYEELYGASLETMVSRARISDLLGNKEKAAEIYQRLKMSGYDIPRDLSEYIDHRLQD